MNSGFNVSSIGKFAQLNNEDVVDTLIINGQYHVIRNLTLRICVYDKLCVYDKVIF